MLQQNKQQEDSKLEKQVTLHEIFQFLGPNLQRPPQRLNRSLFTCTCTAATIFMDIELYSYIYPDISKCLTVKVGEH